MTRIMKILSGILVLCVLSASAEMRIWTSKKGDTMEAEFVNIFAEKVVLRKVDGSSLKIPISGLCAADIKYLQETIPPEVEVEVNVDKDKKTLSSYSSDYGTSGYSRKSQKVKCEVVIKKKSRQENKTLLKAFIYVFSEDSESDDMKVILVAHHEFSFEHKDQITFSTDTASLLITKGSSYNYGQEYCGYVVYIEDDTGKVIDIRASRKAFEKNLHIIKKAKRGTLFDEKFNVVEASRY